MACVSTFQVDTKLLANDAPNSSPTSLYSNSETWPQPTCGTISFADTSGSHTHVRRLSLLAVASVVSVGSNAIA